MISIRALKTCLTGTAKRDSSRGDKVEWHTAQRRMHCERGCSLTKGMEAMNRITEFLDPQKPQPPRSAAQRAASARNGRRSRGPISAAGKARSRLNAVKHALLAKIVAPAHDHRGWDALYQTVRQQLAKEFSPRTCTEHADVDMLSADMLRAAHARRLIEQALQPPRLPDTDQERLDALPGIERDLVLAERFCQAGHRSLDVEEKQALAQRLATIAGDVLRNVQELRQEELEAEADPTPIPLAGPKRKSPEADARLEAAEAAEDEALKRLESLLGPAAITYKDRDHVLALLRRRSMPKLERDRLVALIEWWMPQERRWLSHLRDLQAKAVALQGQKDASLAADPGRIMLLQAYCDRVDRAVDARLARLRGG